ncbi:MAG: GNAT family N-acetyltransferase [Clostridiaceae bacterium]
MNGRNVTIEKVRGIDNEYIIKDKYGITLGIIFTLELSKNNKSSIFRIKIYKRDENQGVILKETLTLMLESLFTKANINKASFVVDEEINYQPFLEMGFTLEGILSNSIHSDSLYRDEYIFGIDEVSYLTRGITANFNLQGSNLELKVLTPSHSEIMANYYSSNKKHLMDFEPSRDEKFYTAEVQRKILAENYKQYLNGNSFNFGIFKDEALIGKLQCSNIVEGSFKSGIIGYSIDKDNENKGYMKEALNIFIEYAFNELNLHRLEGSTLVDNEKSQRVLMKCGFEKLGINKKYLFINGEWRDHITFYKINESY